MFLKISILVTALLIGTALSASIDCSIERAFCAKPQKLYEELGCKAVYGSKSCCAKRFECPDFKKLDEDKCTKLGSQYSIGEILPRNFTDDSKCVETCICTREGSEPAKFICTKSDCGVSSFKVPGCINIYGDLNECCSTSIVCDEAEKKTLASCFVEQTEFREGEKFIPDSNPCYECLCHRDFDNSTIADNPHCRKLNCEIDLRYKSFVQRGCLPVFHSEKCCPVDWECPKIGKRIIKRSAGDDETQTAKQEVFIVTPSKNLEEYLSEVKLSNEQGLLEVSVASSNEPTTTVTSTSQAAIEASVSTSNSQTVTTESHTSQTTVESTSFSTPSSSHSAASNKINLEEHSSNFKSEPKSVIDSESSTASSTTVKLSEIIVEVSTPAAASVSHSETTTLLAESSTASSSNALSTIDISTTFAFLETSTDASSVTAKVDTVSTEASTTTPETTTITTTTTESSKSEDSSESKESGESEEDHSKNLFGEEVEDDEAATEIPSSTQPATSVTQASTIAIESSTAKLTTEALRELLKVLDQPEDLTTLSPAPSSTEHITTASQDITSASSVIQDLSTSNQPSTETTQATTVEPLPLFSAISEIVKAESDVKAPSEVSTPTTQTTEPTNFDNVFPTAFDKLLTTLKEFVAQAEAVTSTEAPKPTTIVSAPHLEQKVEFVNFTVSEQHNEEPKVIVKRSVTAADLIPRYYKQQALSAKEKGCVFDGRSFKIGEIIKTSNDCIKCQCEYAPIGYCVLKEKCIS